jgi:hypothetical protein
MSGNACGMGPVNSTLAISWRGWPRILSCRFFVYKFSSLCTLSQSSTINTSGLAWQNTQLLKQNVVQKIS